MISTDSQHGTIADRQGLDPQLVLQLQDFVQADPALAGDDRAATAPSKRRGSRPASERAPISGGGARNSDKEAAPSDPDLIHPAQHAGGVAIPQSAEAAAEQFKLMMGKLACCGLDMFDEAEIDPCPRQRGALARHGASLTTTYGRCAITLARLEDILVER